MPTLQLPPAGTLTPIDDVDPLRFYYKPLIGRIFRARIDVGLSLLEGRYRRVLEIGYGSGLLIPTLSSISAEVHGVDIEPEPAGLRARLEGLGTPVRDLKQSDVQQLPYPDAYFDAVIAFSIFEHLKPAELAPAMRQVARVLEPRGTFLIGCPAVHRAMNAAFAAIGFSGIDQHHFSSIVDVLDAAESQFDLEKRATLPGPLGRLLPLGWAPYTAALLRKR
jgi:SAM-dependent methyltransferase